MKGQKGICHLLLLAIYRNTTESVVNSYLRQMPQLPFHCERSLYVCSLTAVERRTLFVYQCPKQVDLCVMRVELSSNVIEKLFPV